MTQYIVRQSTVKGEISAPPSKSQTLRSILFGALGNGKTIIHNHLNSSDTASMIDACRLLGASLDVSPMKIEILGLNGTVHHAEDVINAGNSGIVLRFCSAVGALASLPIVITGDHSIRHQRPIKHLLDALAQLGVSAKSMRGDGFAPVIIQGPWKPGVTIVSGEDSQPVSSLLIAGAFADGQTEIRVRNPGEKPWIDLTLNWMDRLGLAYEQQNYERYIVQGKSRYQGFEYIVPGDFSSAAFPIAAALVTQSALTVKNMDMTDLQGDKELIRVLQKMGAEIDIDEANRSLHIKKGKKLSGTTVDINNFVDAITILAVIGCFAEGETVIQNASVAKQKECNRIQCIASELKKMGADITETSDGLRIKGSALKGAQVLSYNDHRMAMSLAIAGMGAPGETTISSTECVSKTFPSFVHDFSLLGANIKEVA